MATEGGFKHIKVTPAEDQEVVIHAGARGSQKPEPPSEAAAAPQASSQPARKGPSVPVPREADASGYRATTLQDIESSKMSPMQIAIIVVAVAAIIAFAVWYAFFS